MKGKVFIEHPEFPPKHFASNWKLSEYYYIHSLGKKTKTTFTMDEGLHRAGADLAAGAAMLADVPTKVGKGKDPLEVHKQNLNKVSSLCERLGKQISQTENFMPSLKRKVSDGVYGSLKKGLQTCRDQRCATLEDIEDWRAMPQTEEEQTDLNELMTKRAKHLAEHLTAMKEAVSQAQGKAPDAVIKAQPGDPDEDEDERCNPKKSKNNTPPPPPKKTLMSINQPQSQNYLAICICLSVILGEWVLIWTLPQPGIQQQLEVKLDEAKQLQAPLYVYVLWHPKKTLANKYLLRSCLGVFKIFYSSGSGGGQGFVRGDLGGLLVFLW